MPVGCVGRREGLNVGTEDMRREGILKGKDEKQQMRTRDF